MDTNGVDVPHKITGSTTTTPADILKAYYLSDRLRLYIDIIGGISVIALLAIGTVKFDEHSTQKPYFWIAPLILIVLLFRPIYLLSASFVEMFVNKGRDKRKISYEIDKEGIFVRLSSGTSIALPWRDIRTARIYTSGLALQIRSGGYWWISKRAFSEEEMTLLERFAREQVVRKQG